MKLLEEGGNQKLRDFCESYKLMEVDIQHRYNTKALEFYRRRNESTAMGTDFHEQVPTYEEGRCFINGRKLDSESNLSTEEEQMVALEPLDPVQEEELKAQGEFSFGKFQQGFKTLFKQI